MNQSTGFTDLPWWDMRKVRALGAVLVLALLGLVGCLEGLTTEAKSDG